MTKSQIISKTVFVACMITAPAAFASSPLICRGGGDISVVHFASLASSQLKTEIQVVFEKHGAAAGANGEQLSPGTCAWQDKAISEAEPGMITDTKADIYLAQSRAGTGKPTITVSSYYDNLNLSDKNCLRIWVDANGNSFDRDPAKPINNVACK